MRGPAQGVRSRMRLPALPTAARPALIGAVVLAAAAPAPAQTYRVYPVPVESPIHATPLPPADARVLIADPSDAIASPFGWHDTDGAAGAEFTITRGNNVHAYADRDGDSLPDPGTEADGGPALAFDFPLDLTLPPEANTHAVVANAFYWFNVFHDVLYQYGFDEGSGNFQTNNYGRGGIGGDEMRLAVQYGGPLPATLTPPDGLRPRTHLFVQPAPTTLSITAPAAIAGEYAAGQQSDWGPDLFDVTRSVVVARDAGGGLALACTPEEIANGPEFADAIVLVLRGSCDYSRKVLNAESLGAEGVIVVNCDPDVCTGTADGGEAVPGMTAGEVGSQVTIPAVLVARSAGLSFLAHSPGVEARIARGVDRDQAFDHGYLTHLYAHGLTSRLTGGAHNPNCLLAAESPSDGWSDWYALMFTQRPGVHGEDPRTLLNYALGLPTPTGGFMPAPYSTDFAINPYTYQATHIYSSGVFLGFVWATILWEVTWDLIDDHGLDPDLYNADGGAGNQLALHLVTHGLKLQPCSPGFVDARDAILAADEALYAGAHLELLWRAFARRGLGYSASQGSSGTNNDNVEAFDLPPWVAGEAEAPALALAVAPVAPNPAGAAAAIRYTLPAAGAARLVVYDVAGRAVATLADGERTAGAHEAALDTRGLSAGVYVVRLEAAGATRVQRFVVAR